MFPAPENSATKYFLSGLFRVVSQREANITYLASSYIQVHAPDVVHGGGLRVVFAPQQ